MAENVIMYAVGDISPGRDRGEMLLAHTAPILKKADITFCQLEQPFSPKVLFRTGGSGNFDDQDKDNNTSPDADELIGSSKDVAALVNAGFNVCSTAGNRCFRMGEEGFLDTLDLLKQNGIQVIGTGRNIAEARQPAILEHHGTKVAFLGYNAVLAPDSEAGVDKPGCVPIHISTTYEKVDWQPATPARIRSWADKDDLAAMIDDIKKVRERADVVGHAAIDAGADLILGHHPHILKGIEVYKGKVIFHSMGNWAFESWINPPLPIGKQIYSKYLGLKTKVDPEYPFYFFTPECRKSLLVKVVISDKKIEQVSFQPAMINKQAQPELLPRSDKRSDEVYEYMERICKDQEMNTTFTRQGDDVVIVT
jgi:hypothetical protein